MNKVSSCNIQELDIKKFLEQISWYKKNMWINQFFDWIKKNNAKISNILHDEFNKKIVIDEIKKKYEIFAIVDRNDNIVVDIYDWNPFVQFRKDCHLAKNKKRFIHRWSDFLIINQKWEILISKRSDDKDSFPWYLEIWWWQCGVNGYKKTLYKETKEELWLSKIDFAEILDWWKYFYEDKQQTQFVNFFIVKIKTLSKIKSDKNEIKSSKRYKINDILEKFINDDIEIIPSHKFFLLMYLKEYLHKNVDYLIKENLEKMTKNKIFMNKF